nr:MAG TPA: hypothetical protein [Siphoviridae sp. ctV7v5]
MPYIPANRYKFALSGAIVPFSHNIMVFGDFPSFFAASTCVKPAFTLAAFNDIWSLSILAFPLSKFLHCYHNLLKVECQQLFYKK